MIKLLKRLLLLLFTAAVVLLAVERFDGLRGGPQSLLMAVCVPQQLGEQ